MRRIFCALLSVLFLMGCIPISANNDFNAVSARIAPLELIDVTLPDAPLSRGEAICALMKLYMRAEINLSNDESVFSDVEEGSRIASYSGYAYKLGFVSGMGDGRLLPDENITLKQFIKIAVSALGWQSVAESNGGYPDGYMSIAVKEGLLKNVPAVTDVFSIKHAMYIIDNMLDAKPLEPILALGKWEHSPQSLYEQMTNVADLSYIDGIVMAVESADLTGGSGEEKGRIRIGTTVMTYDGDDAMQLLGRDVRAYYRYSDADAIPHAVSVYINRTNNELTVSAYDIEKLDTTQCVYMNTQKNSRTKINIDAPEVVYNGSRIASDALTEPATGNVTFVDHDGDKKYDVIFVEEYVSLVVKKVIPTADTLYFKEGFNFRGKNGVRFDFEEEDFSYEFFFENMERAEFSDIVAEDVVSIWADMTEEKIKVVISRSTTEGEIREKDEENISVDGQTYRVYPPNLTYFMSEYALGETGVFSLNHAGEIVDVKGEIQTKQLYGYILAFDSGNGFKKAQVKILIPGEREKTVKENNGIKTISYTYRNGGQEILTLADKVTVFDEYGNKTRKDSSDLTSGQIQGNVLAYELDSDGKIKKLSIISESSDDYAFNSELNSYGGFDNKEAFFIGETTSVICVPTNVNPTDADYEVDVITKSQTPYDETAPQTYKIAPVNADENTQIAECAIIFAEMKADEMANFSDTDNVSIVGQIRVKIVDGEEFSLLEVLTGDKVELLYADFDTAAGKIAKTLSKGDLIRVDKKQSGEITNLQKLASLAALGKEYKKDEDLETGSGSFMGKYSFGVVESIKTDRLHNIKNVMADEIKLDIDGEKKTIILPRTDGPYIYTYNRETTMITPAVPEEILSTENVGSGASRLYVITVKDSKNNDMEIVAVNIVD